MEENQINTNEENKEPKKRKYVRKKDVSKNENIEPSSEKNIPQNEENSDYSAEKKELEYIENPQEIPVDDNSSEEKNEEITIPEESVKEDNLQEEENINEVKKPEESETVNGETAGDINNTPQEIPQEVKEIEKVSAEEKEKDNITPVTKDSNYQISLIDENLLKVKVITDKSVSVDCSIKEKSALSGTTDEKQLNKILIHPKDDRQKQEIEIIVSIGGEHSDIKFSETNVNKFSISEEQETNKLTPNPLVANLIQSFGGEKKKEDYVPKTPEEKLEERIGPKNPWSLNRLFVRKNLTRGFIGALIIYFISMISFYSIASKKNNNDDVVETQRLIVMQDLPENQNLQQHVEDPNKPPEEEKPKVEDDGTTGNKSVPPMIPKKIKKPPRLIGPEPVKKDSSLTTKTDKELDSLRNANNLVKKNGIDTNKFSVYTIPDSLRKDYSENDVGLIIPMIPKNWKVIDSRMINTNQTEFEGILITDTTAKKEGTLNLFIHLDKDGKEFTKEGFKTEFKMADTSSTAYIKDPITQAKNTYYRFYIFTKTDKLYVDAQVKEEFFNEYKNNIEALVRSIRISKPVVNK